MITQTVQGKAQLAAAVLAVDYSADVEIILERSDGKRTRYFFPKSQHRAGNPRWAARHLARVAALIRKIPKECF